MQLRRNVHGNRRARFGSAPFNGNFASLFPGAYQVVQSDLGLTYGGTPKPTSGNTSTATMALTGTLAGTPVPIWLALTSGSTGNIYYDGAGITPAMTGVTVAAGLGIALTGAGSGLTITPSAGTLVSPDSWKATCSALADQSGNGKHYTQAAAAAQPIVTIGVMGKCGLLFDGVDDYMDSACATPAPGTTSWVGFFVFKTQVFAGGNLRAFGPDQTAILEASATSLQLYGAGTFGPAGSGISLGALVAVDYLRSNSVADYIRVGSGSVATGVTTGNATSATKTISNAAFPAVVEVFAVGYAPASVFNSVAFRAAASPFYGAAV